MRLPRTAGITILATALIAPLFAGTGTAASEITLCSASGIGAATCTFTCPSAGTNIFFQVSSQMGASTATGRCTGSFVAADGCAGGIGLGTNGCTHSFESDGGAGIIAGAGGGFVGIRAWIVA